MLLNLLNKIDRYFDLKSKRSIEDVLLHEIIYEVKNLQVNESIRGTNLELIKKKIIVDRFQAYLNYINSEDYFRAENEIQKAVNEIQELLN